MRLSQIHPAYRSRRRGPIAASGVWLRKRARAIAAEQAVSSAGTLERDFSLRGGRTRQERNVTASPSKTSKGRQDRRAAAVDIEDRIGERDQVRKEANAVSRQDRRQDNIESFDAPKKSPSKNQ